MTPQFPALGLGEAPAARLLDVWEQGRRQPPWRRALLLLHAAGAPAALEADELERLSVGQRDHLLLSLRAQLFGPDLDSVVDCPACGERLEFRLDADELQAQLAPAGDMNVADHGEVTAPGPDGAAYHVRFRLPNSLDLAALEAIEDFASARQQLFERCVLAVERRTASPLRTGSPVHASELPAEIVEAVVKALAAADPAADLRLQLTCPTCGRGWEATFDILAFLWRELEDWAQRTLLQVHTLALAYGWREADILALSPQRRRFYLDMVTA